MIYFLNDHKVGYMLSKKIMPSLCPKAEKKTFFRFWHHNNSKDKYVIFIRHPYEIITSGYFYHKVCNEIWAIKDCNFYTGWFDKFNKEDKIRNHQVIEKANFSIGLSFRDKLKYLSLLDGLELEMITVGYMTIFGMYEWPHYDKENVLVVKLEDFFDNFDFAISKICNFLKIAKKDVSEHNIYVKSQVLVDSDNHITNKMRIKHRYKEVWTKKLYEKAAEIFPSDLLERLGYEI